MRFQIAFRNVFRNQRRTFLNIVMIAGGISAIVVFRGFSHHMISRLQEVAINSQYGHLQIASLKTWNMSAQDTPRDRLISLSPAMLTKIKDMPEVDYVSGRLTFYGLISNSDNSMSARGSAFDPYIERQLQSSITIIQGRPFSPDAKFEVLLGSGLQKQMGVGVGSSLSLLAYTFDGSVNALDAEIVGIFQTNLAEVDDTTFFVPLVTAQKLLDTDLVERFVVQLKDTGMTNEMKKRVHAILPEGLDTKSWSELATLYMQVVAYYRVQNFLIEWILMLLVLLSIANTVGMAVSERTGEIGTVRAMGDTRKDLILQFLTEGLVLGLAGGAIGCLIAFALAHFVTALQIPMVMPGASVPLLVQVDLLPHAFVKAVIMTCTAAVLASLIPAYRASRFKIVDALKYNV